MCVLEHATQTPLEPCTHHTHLVHCRHQLALRLTAGVLAHGLEGKDAAARGHVAADRLFKDKCGGEGRCEEGKRIKHTHKKEEEEENAYKHKYTHTHTHTP